MGPAAGRAPGLALASVFSLLLDGFRKARLDPDAAAHLTCRWAQSSSSPSRLRAPCHHPEQPGRSAAGIGCPAAGLVGAEGGSRGRRRRNGAAEWGEGRGPAFRLLRGLHGPSTPLVYGTRRTGCELVRAVSATQLLPCPCASGPRARVHRGGGALGLCSRACRGVWSCARVCPVHQWCASQPSPPAPLTPRGTRHILFGLVAPAVVEQAEKPLSVS